MYAVVVIQRVDIYVKCFMCILLSTARDPHDVKRSVSHISWYPDGAHKLAAAYSILEFQKFPTGMNPESYIWDISECT